MRKARSVSAPARAFAARARATKRSIRLVAVFAIIAAAAVAAISAPSSAKLLDRLIGASAAPAGVAAAEKATVSTDKGVYEPGETVTFHGSNWTPGETVTIVLSEGANAETRATIRATVDEHGSFVATMTMPEGDEAEAEREAGKTKRAEVIYRAVATGSASGASVRTHFKGREREEEEGEDDADLPRFMVGKIGKEDYLTRRAEHTNRLRGIERGKPFDPGARGRAIRELDRHQGKSGKQSDALKGSFMMGAATDASGAKTGAEGATLSGASFALAGAPGWTSIGPAPIPNGQTFGVSHAVSGRVTAIAIHPTNPDIAYVAAAQGGVYRTLDGGATWTAIFDNAQTLSVGSLAIAPSQPSTLYVGTGEGNFSCDSYFGVGVYRIDNADGAAPALTGPFTQDIANNDVLTGRSIQKVLVHPTNPDTIFIAVTNGVGGLGCDAGTATASRGLYRSTNATSGSATFQKIALNTANSGNRSVTDMEFEPGNPNTMLATVVGFSTANDGGVYRSTNALAATPTFTQTLSTGTGSATARTELALNKIGGAVTVYAAISDSNGTVKRSLDGGVTWSGVLANATGFCGTQCTYDMPIAVDPTNANVIYIGGNADGTLTAILKKSTNAMSATPTFTKIQNGLHADSHAIEIDPSNNNTVWFGNDGGVWKSANGGASWTSLNNTGFNATQFQSLALHPIDPNYMIGGTQDNGTERQRPDGTWTRTDFGDGGFALIDQSATNTTTVRQYHTYFNQTGTLMGFGTSTSSTAFENWTLLGCGGTANGISCSDSAVLFYAPMALGPGTPNTVYFGTDKLYRSANSGTTMTAVSQTFVSTVPVSAIGISPQNDAVRVVGLRNGKVYRTVTGASPMADVTGTLPARYVSRVVVDPNNQNTAYVTHAAYTGNTSAHIYKTTNLSDAAPIWTPVGGVQIPDVPVNAFAVDPADSNTLYAGTDIGVYRSLDGGATWSAFSDGLPRVAVFDMAVHAPSRKLRIATHGRGIWEISIANSPAVIQGVVTDAGNSAPIANASVTAGSNSTTTDENGFYQFQSIPAGAYNMTVTAVGYVNGTATNVAAANGSATTRNFALTAAPSAQCPSDTHQSDFLTGMASNVDLNGSPGDIKLPPTSQVTEQTTLSTSGNAVTTTTWEAQTFVAEATGKVTQIDTAMFCSGCTGAALPVTVELRTVSGGAPTSTVLATATTPAFTSGSTNYYAATFNTPATVTAGTTYAYVLRLNTNPTPGTYASTRSATNVYASGNWLQSTTSGTSWVIPTSGGNTLDLGFRVYIGTGFVTSGNFVSSPKDANQADGTMAAWSTISWNATTPPGTAIKMQAGASNNPGGLFTFVGPDGTPNTYFNSGDSLAQFNGFRYLKYKAYLSTADTSVTPTLSDVTICNSNTPLPATSLNISPATGVYGGTTTLTATLTTGGSPLAGKPVTFKLNGANFPGNTATTDAAGVATIPNVSLAGLNAGVYAGYVTAKFASDSSYAGTNGTNSLTVEKATPAVVWNNPADITYGTALGASQLNATADVAGGFVYTPAAGTVLDAGSQTLSVGFTPADTTNYNTVTKEVTLNVLKAAPIVNANGVTCTYTATPCEATGTAKGVDGADLGAVTLVYTPGGSAPVNVGDYTVVASIPETANHTAGSSAAAAVRVNQATPFINWANPSAISYGTPLGASQLNAAATLGAGGTAVPGTYTYTPAAGTVLSVGNGQTLHVDFVPADTANFTSASKDVTINVVKAVLTVTTVDASKVYGTANPAFAVTYSGFLNGDTAASLGGTLTFTTAATTTTGAGVYPVTPGGLTSANYSLNFVAGNLTIEKAALTVTADNQTRLLGAANPAFTVSYSGFALGQNASVLGGTLTFTTPATAASPVGTYAITPSGLTSPNYAITYVDGQLFVTYGVCALYDPEKAAQSGSTIPVKLQLCDAGGANFSAPGVVVHATSAILITTNAPAALADSGNANPDMNFRYTAGTPGMYIFNLSTKGYASGTYLLNFVVTGDPVPHSVKFSVR